MSTQVVKRHFFLKFSSITVSLVVALPIFFVLLTVFKTSGETWSHIRSTVLPEYLWNTFLLMLQVAAYTLLIGISTAWLTACVLIERMYLRWVSPIEVENV